MAGNNKIGKVENLKPFNQMSKEEAKKIQTKGGYARAEKERARKTMREQAELLLSLPLKDKAAKKKLKELGVELKEQDNQMLIILQLWRRAAGGDLEATKLLMELMGEKAATQVNISGELNNPFKDLTTEELRELIQSE